MLLLIDGHDEYQDGCNSDIDEATKKKILWGCWVIELPEKLIKLYPLKKFMDAEAEIKGFDKDNVDVIRCLRNRDEAAKLLDQTEARNIYQSDKWNY